MSHKLINHSPDLKKLRDAGYEIEIRNGHLLVHSIPYVTPGKQIALGTLVCVLSLGGERTAKPPDHTAHFSGETPCDKNGSAIKGIINSSERKILAEGVEVCHYFSAKPPSGNYADYHEKVSTYVTIIESHAQSVDPSVSAKTHKVIGVTDQDTAFHYIDTNSSRAEIMAISEKLSGLKIAIIGLGGTGSYILDFVAKTPVKEIHLFDKDYFLSHNAFRAPGAPSLTKLEESPTKVRYLCDVYSQMHKHIIPHEYHIDDSTSGELLEMDFVFVCIDQSEVKKSIIEKLNELSIPFVDTGIGIIVIDNALTGGVRVTTGTSEKNDHIKKMIPFAHNGNDDYNKNIQIAELNALNAVLAIIKWKKLFGFYHDLEKEHNTVYDINVNKLLNNETVS